MREARQRGEREKEARERGKRETSGYDTLERPAWQGCPSDVQRGSRSDFTQSRPVILHGVVSPEWQGRRERPALLLLHYPPA